jgi:hypothetical protein
MRIDPALKEAAEVAATDDHRSLTNLIESLLAKHLRNRGQPAPDREAPPW